MYVCPGGTDVFSLRGNTMGEDGRKEARKFEMWIDKHVGLQVQAHGYIINQIHRLIDRLIDR